MPGQTLEPRDTFARWQEQNFSAADAANPAVGGPNADPDGDGLSNLLEYALGTSPRQATPGAIVTGVQSLAGQSYLTLTYHQLEYSADLAYQPQASTDLVHWQAATPPEVVSSATDNGDGTETTVVRDAHPLGTFPRRFLRLQVTVPTVGFSSNNFRAK